MVHTPEVADKMANLVFAEESKLILCKLSSLLSQSSVEELLMDFVSSESAEVCVLLANMQETTRKTINHIRVMIEEAELRTPAQHSKVFALLLHFPPSQFYQHCYPSLFLRGWDHCYLDALAHSTVKGVANVQDWFLKCCFPARDHAHDTLLQTLTELLPQTVSIISARVSFGNKKDGSFNSTMNGTQRNIALRTLLFDKGVGKVLCEKFRVYWEPKVMAEHLERAATFSKQRESTLNMTDAIQTQLKALFVDFCVYMLTLANENFNLDTIYAEDTEDISIQYSEESSSPMQKLFLNIFMIFPARPQLFQLNWLSNNLPSLQSTVQSLQFPFFSSVYEEMEKQVELSGEAANIQLDLLADHASLRSKEKSSSSPDTKMQALMDAVLADLTPKLQVRRVFE